MSDGLLSLLPAWLLLYLLPMAQAYVPTYRHATVGIVRACALSRRCDRSGRGLPHPTASDPFSPGLGQLTAVPAYHGSIPLAKAIDPAGPDASTRQANQ
ncbi:hypothetical protein BD309DRAFT_103872 [Dichomitus squalens]|uniref:uncharacterized protein n=1 Tax=Dichomitus squalens (strain LYAD-421) TaxID=732165 RepID=UPI000441277B|nr:uncharacterized protein DICSQDRAFT_133898 [Dichomitus squalens LYAD-421 SS1]EJF64235.1 hypothetical protein DICSQDRAFT_133898 [Dichomitus squalens LYAD-421 SS1]TBU43525.1 hypothetical protein BD309DRAFT_103872 [Dichomitus squalens]